MRLRRGAEDEGTPSTSSGALWHAAGGEEPLRRPGIIANLGAHGAVGLGGDAAVAGLWCAAAAGTSVVAAAAALPGAAAVPPVSSVASRLWWGRLAATRAAGGTTRGGGGGAAASDRRNGREEEEVTRCVGRSVRAGQVRAPLRDVKILKRHLSTFEVINID